MAFYLVCSVNLNFELIFIVIFFGYEAWINDVQSIKRLYFASAEDTGAVLSRNHFELQP